MTEPAKPAKPAEPTKKGPNFAIIFFILLMCIALSIGIGFLGEQKSNFEWLRNFVFSFLPIVVIGLIASKLFGGDKKDDSHH
jgi:hypothetical protein